MAAEVLALYKLFFNRVQEGFPSPHGSSAQLEFLGLPVVLGSPGPYTPGANCAHERKAGKGSLHPSPKAQWATMQS